MSTVPASHTEISENPSSMAVTSAVSPAAKEADVQRKLKGYGVLQALRDGRYPNNKQIGTALSYALNHSPVDIQKLSPDGQKLITDMRDIISTAQEIVAQKNADEEVQNFLYHTRKTDFEQVKKGNTPTSKEEVKDDAQRAAAAFRTLGKLLVTNSEARKLLQDLGLVGRDIFADAAVKASDVARPDQERLQRVDEPAPSDQFHDDLPSRAELSNKKEELKAQAQGVASEVQDHARDVQAQTEAQANPQDPNVAPEESAQVAGQGAKEKLNQLKEKIPEKHRDLAKEQAEKAKNYLSDKFPEERRDQFIFRLKKVIVEVQRHRDYQDAVDFFLTKAEQYQAHAQDVTGQAKSNVGDLKTDSSFSTAEHSFRTLLERFANGRSTEPMFAAVNHLYADAKEDPELRAWFSRLDTYIRKVLIEPGFVMKDEANTEARDLKEASKRFFGDADTRGKYSPHKDALFSEIETFFKGMGEDPLNVKFGEDWKRLTKDLFLDNEGKPTFKPHLWADIRSVILPDILKRIGYVPIPRIEYSDKAFDLVIENLTLEGQNLMPNIFEIDARNYFKISPYAQLGDVHTHSAKITFSQVQADMRDVAFYFYKKTGFPKIRDSGIADVFIGGSGISATVHIQSVQNDPHSNRKSQSMFQVKSVSAKVDKLTFAIRDSRHNTLYKALRPLATSIIKKQLCKGLEDGIRTALETLDTQLVSIRDNMEEANARDDKSRTEVVREIFERKKASAQHTAQANQPSGTFKVVTNKRDSILRDQGNPQGWINRIENREQAAKQGEGWQSEAFSIVEDANSAGVNKTALQDRH